MKGYLGEVKIFAGERIPTHWRICDGSELKIEEYPNLYEVLKTKYGGNDVDTFKLPDIKTDNGVLYIICVDGEYPK